MNCNVKLEGRNITFIMEDLLEDHCFLDYYWGINAANSDKGDNSSCCICLIPPNQYINTITVESLKTKYPDLKRFKCPQDPIFKNCKNMIRKLLGFKNVLHSYGSLCNMCIKPEKLNDDDYRMVENLCNETVERTLKLTSGRYGFSKKLHYILHYPEIAKNFNDQLKNIATSRFESNINV
uniref:Uncharacterized protein n=1 Tax=Strongyloides venezuelensis TaxID=75913 RepID=A0A0K0FWC7_STRVS